VAASAAQTPVLYDVGNVVVGAKRIPTEYLLAEGQWSDAGEHIGLLSTQIHCYKQLGFCSLADADWDGTGAIANLVDFDILRWNVDEIIAVDSSPDCAVNTIRVDLKEKRVTMSSAEKGKSNDAICKKLATSRTAVLLGSKEIADKQAKRYRHAK